MKRGNMFLYVVLAGAVLSACTSIDVRRADPATGMRHVCIQENPKVTVPDFLTVLRDGIDRNGLSSEVYSGQKPEHCQFLLTYTALRSWDLGTYLSHAELRIEKDGRQLAAAQYHLRGKGGLALNKWRGVEAKMAPVIDELFAGYRGLPAATASATEPADAMSQRVAAEQPGPSKTAPPVAAVPATSTGDAAFAYTDDPAAAARALALGKNCSTGFQKSGSEGGRDIYSAICWGSKKLLIACEQGECRETR